MLTNFQQSIDVDRPHTCLTVNPNQSSSLIYRYDDTQEIVTVPNIWYNQTFQTRVVAVRWEAQLKDEAAERFKRTPPLGLSEAAINQIVGRYRAHAVRIRAEADRMEIAGVVTHPVKASHIQLNYSAEAAA